MPKRKLQGARGDVTAMDDKPYKRTNTTMHAKQTIRASANFALLCVFVEASCWRIKNWSAHVQLVSRVTIGCPPWIAAILILVTCAVELGCSSASLRLRDGRPACILLLPLQLASYALFQTCSLPVVFALVLACLQTTQQLEKSHQNLDDGGLIGRVERNFRKWSTRVNVAAPMVGLVFFELVGVAWRLGEDGYAAAINHDRNAFSLALMAVSLRIGSFDETPLKLSEHATDRAEHVIARAREFACKIKAVPGTAARDGSKKL